MATSNTIAAASNANAANAANAVEAPPASRKRLWMIIAALVLLLGAAAGAYLTMKPAAEKKPEPVVVAPPVFMELEPFTVNLNDDHILQSSLSLQLRSEEDTEQMKRYLPQVRSRLLMLISARDAESLKSPEGKETLARDIGARLQQAYATGLKPPVITGVFFTAFVIQ